MTMESFPESENVCSSPVSDADGPLDLFDPVIREWWTRSFGEYRDVNGGLFTPPQVEAIPHIHRGRHTLICSPTGSGKTLSAFIAIINELYGLARSNSLENSVYCLYISPLKSLANDIKRNLEDPLEGIRGIGEERGVEAQEIRQAIRHGDTPSSERSAMLDTTPHILNTTPETLAILLNSPKFKQKFKTLRWVVVDEIHALADNKRGVHLSLSLERLRELVGDDFVRIGCSATVEPLGEIATYLGGYDDEGEPRPVEIVDTRFVRDFDIRLHCPVPDLINTPASEVSDRLYEMLHKLIQDHTNTLIFTNTRSGAERVLYNLRRRYPDYYDEGNSGCHHGSIGKEGRLDVEESLKHGDIRVVTSSTSLELGIDMPYLDLVVQIGSPKSVAALLQRVGRAGHTLGQTVKGRLIALDRDELVECAVMLKKAYEGFIDSIYIPHNSSDVLAQHIFGMAIAGPLHIDEIKRIVRRSYNYHDLGEDEFQVVIDYLTASHAGMEDRNIYAKIWVDEDTGMVGKRGRLARVIYYTNLGTIPDEFSCDVFTRGDKKWVGKLDEQYLDKLRKGDVFVLGGRHLEFKYRRGGKVYVDPTNKRPTVPSWFSERLPLSFDLARNILEFKEEMLQRRREGDRLEWLKGLPIDANSALSLHNLFDQQIRYLDEESVSTPTRLVIEEHEDRETHRRYYHFHSTYGRRVNEGLSRMVAYTISQAKKSNITVSVSDNGFTVGMPISQRVDIEKYVLWLTPDSARETLRSALKDTQLLKRMFRINAARSFMILRNYKGHRKSARRQQLSADMLIHYAYKLDRFAVLEETYREIIEDKLELQNIKRVLGGISTGDIEIEVRKVKTPSPLAFGIASLSASDAVLAEDKNQLLKEFHRRVMQEIGETGTGDTT